MRDTTPGLTGKERFLQEVPTRILVACEGADDVGYYTAVLRSRGYAVSSATCFEDAAKTIARTTFDLVIVSQGGTDFKSKPVLEVAVERDRQMPVIVLTRAVNVDCYIDAVQLGAVDYVETPLSPGELANLVSAHVRPRVLAA